MLRERSWNADDLFWTFFAAEFDVDCVISNNFYGMYTATRHLVKKGHKKIAYVGSVKSKQQHCGSVLWLFKGGAPVRP